MTNRSYVSGASSIPLLGQTIGAALDAAAERWAKHPALVVRDQNVRWTYEELQEQVDAFAIGLLALGLKRGDRLGIWSPNNSEWVVSQFASAKIGVILVTINPVYRTAELSYALRKVGCKALVAATEFKGSRYFDMLRELAPELSQCEPGKLSSEALPDLEVVIQIGGPQEKGALPFDAVSKLGAVQHESDLREISSRLQFDDAINIQFTSGTTGAPKGATLTHHNILNNGYFAGVAMGLTPQDRLCIPVPFYHCFGMVLSNLACVAHGSTMVVPGAAFDPLEVLKTIEAERCTALHGVPTMFIAELEHPEFSSFDLSSLRTGMMAGSPCPVEIMRRVIGQMGAKEITIGYGMTETSPTSFQTGRDDTLDRRVSTVGRVHPHVEVKIVDAQGHIVPFGTVGELCTRGYSIMKGYWADETRTAEAIDQDGWMHTGDLATLDAGGYCNIVGRIKDLVIRGGENVYPREIEEYLYAHPKIQDVQVFGVPDKRYGEELCAYICLKAGERATDEEIRAFCRGQIAHYKIPRHIRFVETFPTTVTGKVQKFVMRQQMIDELGLAEVRTA
ncbi:AMP-binding protein [Afipia clevelandensis]|uniref:3-methylmercaptopropionyl-CoA ligase n=1 Tax=Afipia clevelandensis ATCC 49720 TaxID=883079 RepID=K8P5M5_9BRAD|nr:AMP-binding protein [Afipia clevelandensis]EKS36044.1 hypothetical protein HMPREF9696_02256 [Afipia clevelandensis ATCC 49720]